MIQKIKNAFYLKFKTSFAKSGMDIQLFQILKQKNRGFYIDVGSHHPIMGSNSFFFYIRGWKGLCIDPNPEFITEYKNKRKKDIFLNIGVSDSTDSQMNYYKLKKGLSERNSFSIDYIESNNLLKDVEKVLPIQIKTLAQILDETNIPLSGIDFLTIDCEGLDFQVLKSNNWDIYRPRIVIIETHDFLYNDIISNSTKYLDTVGYKLIGKNIQGEHVGNLIFVQK